MSLNTEQFKFSQDIMSLLLFIWSKGWRVTFGEAHRTQSQQILYFEGLKVERYNDEAKLVSDMRRTRTLYSNHQKRLAMDFNFFKPDGGSFVLTYEKEELQQFGDHWESLNPENRWGGNFKSFTDTPHFERHV